MSMRNKQKQGHIDQKRLEEFKKKYEDSMRGKQVFSGERKPVELPSEVSKAIGQIHEVLDDLGSQLVAVKMQFDQLNNPRNEELKKKIERSINTFKALGNELRSIKEKGSKVPFDTAVIVGKLKAARELYYEALERLSIPEPIKKVDVIQPAVSEAISLSIPPPPPPPPPVLGRGAIKVTKKTFTPSVSFPEGEIDTTIKFNVRTAQQVMPLGKGIEAAMRAMFENARTQLSKALHQEEMNTLVEKLQEMAKNESESEEVKTKLETLLQQVRGQQTRVEKVIHILNDKKAEFNPASKELPGDVEKARNEAKEKFENVLKALRTAVGGERIDEISSKTADEMLATMRDRFAPKKPVEEVVSVAPPPPPPPPPPPVAVAKAALSKKPKPVTEMGLTETKKLGPITEISLKGSDKHLKKLKEDIGPLFGSLKIVTETAKTCMDAFNNEPGVQQRARQVYTEGQLLEEKKESLTNQQNDMEAVNRVIEKMKKNEAVEQQDLKLLLEAFHANVEGTKKLAEEMTQAATEVEKLLKTNTPSVTLSNNLQVLFIEAAAKQLEKQVGQLNQDMDDVKEWTKSNQSIRNQDQWLLAVRAEVEKERRSQARQETIADLLALQGKILFEQHATMKKMAGSPALPADQDREGKLKNLMDALKMINEKLDALQRDDKGKINPAEIHKQVNETPVVQALTAEPASAATVEAPDAQTTLKGLSPGETEAIQPVQDITKETEHLALFNEQCAKLQESIRLVSEYFNSPGRGSQQEATALQVALQDIDKKMKGARLQGSKSLVDLAQEIKDGIEGAVEQNKRKLPGKTGLFMPQQTTYDTLLGKIASLNQITKAEQVPSSPRKRGLGNSNS